MTTDMTAAIAAIRCLPVNFLTTNELAQFLRCDRKTVQRLVYRGVLNPVVAGTVWRFDRAEAVAALRRSASR
jgi:excisionase family DNA binding protein